MNKLKQGATVWSIPKEQNQSQELKPHTQQLLLIPMGYGPVTSQCHFPLTNLDISSAPHCDGQIEYILPKLLIFIQITSILVVK